MDANELLERLTALNELLNQILPAADDKLLATPQQWRELNESTRTIADGTQDNADFWRDVEARNRDLTQS